MALSDTSWATNRRFPILHECERQEVVLLDLYERIINHPTSNFIQTRRKLESILQIGSLIKKEYGRN